MNKSIHISILLLVATAAQASTSRLAESKTDPSFLADPAQMNHFKVLSPVDPRHPRCEGLNCPPILATPFNPGLPPGPGGYTTGAENIRIRFILDTIHNEVISGDGVAPNPFDKNNFIVWNSDCLSPKCSGAQTSPYEYFLPQPGETIDDDLVVFEHLQIADPGPDYYYGRCSDFGGGGLPAGGALPYDHDVYVIADGNQLGYGFFSDGIYHPGTYTIDYQFDISDGENTSRLHFDGWAVVQCTADDTL